MRVSLWAGYDEDRRLSMQVYGTRLDATFRGMPMLGCQSRLHTPRLQAALGHGPWAMRWARYVRYPWQVRHARADVHHIVDHGYAQLLYVLDSARTVVTVHDVIPLVRWAGALPGTSSGNRPWLNELSSRALRRAAHIIAISENTRRDVIHYAQCDPSRITVIHHGIDEEFRVFSPADRARARERWELPDDGTRRVLVVGASYYKNLSTAVEAFAALRGSVGDPIQLVGVGTGGREWDETIRRCGLSGAVRSLGSVAARDMPEVYNCVDLLLFPSLYEGFGRPPVEAMACGVPSVVSNTSSLPEAVGDAAVMCHPHDASGLASAMHQVLFDSTRRAKLVADGLVWARRFSWSRAAQLIGGVYQTVLSTRPIVGGM
jgi:glycosyltransferase involved in cell wall biosynthesis